MHLLLRCWCCQERESSRWTCAQGREEDGLPLMNGVLRRSSGDEALQGEMADQGNLLCSALVAGLKWRAGWLGAGAELRQGEGIQGAGGVLPAAGGEGGD